MFPLTCGLAAGRFDITVVCRVREVSRLDYYEWRSESTPCGPKRTSC